MNKIIPFAKISKKIKNNTLLSHISVVVDKNKKIVGFVLGRDSFLDLLQHIDNEFQEKVKDQERAYNNSAGKLIDIIEDTMELKPEFIKQLKKSVATKKDDLISMREIKQLLHV